MKNKNNDVDYHVRMSKELANAVNLYCAENKIESKPELIRVAIAKYVFPDSSDTALQYVSLADIQKKLQDALDVQNFMFEYLQSMHKHLLIFKNNIPKNLETAALNEARKAYSEFYKNYIESLKDTPPFLERMFHNIRAETGNGSDK